jgi:hypothetical protein
MIKSTHTEKRYGQKTHIEKSYGQKTVLVVFGFWF